jgi:hypothetical protein
LHHAVPPVEGSKLGSVNIDGKGLKGDGGEMCQRIFENYEFDEYLNVFQFNS